MKTLLCIVSYNGNPDQSNLDSLEMIDGFEMNVYIGPVFTERHQWHYNEHVRKIEDMCMMKNENLKKAYEIIKGKENEYNIAIMDSDKILNDKAIEEYKSKISDDTIIYYPFKIKKTLYNKNIYKNMKIWLDHGATINNPFLMNGKTFIRIYEEMKGNIFKNKDSEWYNEELGFTDDCFYKMKINFKESKNWISELR